MTLLRKTMQLKEAIALLRMFKRGDKCWCEMAIGNPMMSDHDEKCKVTRLFLEDIDRK